jgi:hypothetical protein
MKEQNMGLTDAPRPRRLVYPDNKSTAPMT